MDAGIQLIKKMIQDKPESSLKTIINLCKLIEDINIHSIAELFMIADRPKEMTAFLVECMNKNKNEDKFW